MKENATAKFDETIEVAMNLGVDPRHADQMVRGITSFRMAPEKRCGLRYLLVVIRRRKRASGADIVGAEELVEKIEEVKSDLIVVYRHLIWPVVGKLGRVLGPRPYAKSKVGHCDARY